MFKNNKVFLIISVKMNRINKKRTLFIIVFFLTYNLFFPLSKYKMNNQIFLVSVFFRGGYDIL